MATYNITAEQLKEGGILNSFEMPAVGSFTNVYSLDFDGVDDYVVSNAAYTHLSSATAMSVSLWFKSSNYTTLGRLLFVGKHVEIKQNSALYSNTQGTFSYILKGNFGNAFATLGGATNLGVGNLVDGNWHHICFTWDGSTNTAIVYEDGVAKVTNTSANGTLNNSTTEKYSVGAQNNGSNPIDGLVDEVAIWTTALSSSDVTAIYNSGVPNNLNDLNTTPTTWWRFEEGSGTTAIDSGTGGNNGTLKNGTAYSTDVPS